MSGANLHFERSKVGNSSHTSKSDDLRSHNGDHELSEKLCASKTDAEQELAHEKNYDFVNSDCIV